VSELQKDLLSSDTAAPAGRVLPGGGKVNILVSSGTSVIGTFRGFDSRRLHLWLE
jgi:hypothetical protein